MTVRFHDSDHPLFQTTDTFQQLIQDLNHFGDIVDSDMKYLDSAIGPGGSLALNGLSDFTANTLVDALNELDSDLHGSGGGSGSDLDTQAKTVVGAINEIEAVYDANAGKITTDSALSVTSAGAETHTVAGNFEVDASGDITLDADGQNVTFKDGGVTRLDFAMGATNTLSVTNNLIVDAVGDITLDADGNGIIFKNGAGGDTVTHQLTDAAAYNVTYPGNVTHSVTGDLIYEVTGKDLVIKDSADEKLRINITNTPNITFAGTQSSIVNTAGTFSLNIVGDIVLDADGGDVFVRDDGVQYARLQNNSGQVRFYSGANEIFRGDSADMNVRRAIQLPASGAGTPHTTAKTLHGALAEINDRVPNVYDRNGVLLNS